MVENTFKVGKTQWSKWNDAGREAHNKMRRLGFTYETGVSEANAVVARAAEAHKAVEQWEDTNPEPETTPDPKPRVLKRQKGK
jgi:hypothetical protein